MALLSLKKNTAPKKVIKKTTKLAVVDDKKSVIPATMTSSIDLSGIIIRPRVTEKVALLSTKDRTIVSFDVSARANKRNVAEAVKMLYKVTAEKVSVLRIHPKKSVVRGREVKGKTFYKAYVYLKKGEKLEIV